MIPLLVAFLSLMAAPFWESHPPAQWSDAEIETFLSDSPWAQVAPGPGNASVPVVVRLATAGPIQDAEKEQVRRASLRRKSGPAAVEDPGAVEYRLWLEDNRATQIVIAIRMSTNQGLLDEREIRRMEDESVMRVGKRKIKMTGHFPPSAGDPYLRMAFPREVQASDKTLAFELYLPGVSAPFRAVEFKLKDMIVRGKLEL
jgi:hypothetical protein